MKKKSVNQEFYIQQKNEGEIKIFPDEQKPMRLITGRPALKEILKGEPQAKMKGHQTATQSYKKK